MTESRPQPTVMTPESQRQLPFLKRNIARAVNAFSGAFGTPVLGRRENGVPTDDGEHPRKRRRVSSPGLDFDKLIATPRASDPRPTLRVEVLRCHHKDTKQVQHSFSSVVSPDATTKANCRVTISDMTFGRPRVLHCESQTCQVITFKNPAGPHRVARVELPRPFYVPRDCLLVNRIDDAVFDLSDAYKMSVELESADGTNWPPLDGNDLDSVSDSSLPSSSTRYWVFTGEFEDLFGRLKAPLVLTARTGPEELTYETDYVMDIDLQWTSGFMALKRLENGAKPCITAIDPHDPKTNGQLEQTMEETLNGFEDDGHENGDVMNGDQTPSRSLRTRGGEKNYNLKALSDQAHGRKQKRRKTNPDAPISEGRIKYFLPPDQPVCLDGFRCVNCGIFHQSLKHLQLHLETTHPDYDYRLETTSQGPQFHVSSLPDPPTTPSKSFSIGHPVSKSFNLETFIAGDRSWLRSRLDSESKDDFITSAETKAAFTKLGGKPGRGKSSRKTSQTRISPSRKKIVIPELPYTFYHHVSKQVIGAGQIVPDAVVEKQWLHHKHRDTLNDVKELTASELEYMKEFDSVMREHDISARAYLPRAWLDFVRKRAAWLVESKHRMVEFAMHESYLLASDLIRDEHIDEALGYIEEERAKKQKMQRTSPDEEEQGASEKQKPPEPPAKMPPIRKSASGCAVCSLPVLAGPQLLRCSNEVCLVKLTPIEMVDTNI